MNGEITITDRAAERIKDLIARADHGRAIRVKVIEGGCSGLEYRLDIDTPRAEDRIFEKGGARVLLDSKTLLILSGTELDFKSDSMQSSFVFNNPNAKRTCGCGTSFSA